MASVPVHSFVTLDDHTATVTALEAQRHGELQALYEYTQANIASHRHIAPEHSTGYVAAMKEIAQYLRRS